jgi:hypothetical protein
MKKARYIAFLFFVSSIILSGDIFANDGSASLTPEGLQFVKAGNVSIEEEELFLSIRQIKVEYIFYNNSNKDFETYVVFPLPDDGPDVIIREGHFFDDFTVFVNDKKVRYKQEIKFVNAESNEYLGRQIRYYWKQKFPAKKKLKIFHSYRPEEGMSWGNFNTNNGLVPTSKEYDTFQDGYKFTYSVGYILKTAKLWKGPIKKFKLTIEKDLNDRIRFILNGEKIIIDQGKSRYQTIISNFIPSNDIDLEWYSNINYRELIDGRKAQP